MGRYGSDKAFDGWKDVPAETPSFGGGDPQAALRDPRFLSMVREFYREQGEFVGTLTDNQIIDKFYSDRNWADLNTAGAVADAADAYGMGAEQRQRARMMQEVWNGLPNMFQEGGRGLGAVGDVAKALVLDPVNLVGGIAGKAAASAGTRAALAAGKTAEQAVRKGVVQGATKAGLSEGLIGGVAEAGVNAATQHRDIGLGLQEDFSYGQMAGSAAMGAGLGAVAGGLIALPPAFAGAKDGQKIFEDLRNIGIPDEEIVALTERQVRALDNPETRGEFLVSSQAARRALAQAAEEEAAEAAAVAPEAAEAEPINTANAKLERLVQAQQRAYDNARADDADADTLAEAEETLGVLNKLRGFGERLEREHDEIVELTESNDPKKLAEAKKRRAIFERDYADYRALMEGADDEDAAEAIARFEQRRAIPAPKEEDAPAPAADPAAAEPTATTAPAAKAPAQDSAPASDKPIDEAEAAAPVPEASPVKPEPVFGTDSARALAAFHGLDPSTIPATGRKGRILLKDVKAYAKAEGLEAPTSKQLKEANEAPAEAEAEQPAIQLEDAPAQPVKVAENARKRAAALGIDVNEVPANNNGKTVTRGDVNAYHKKLQDEGAAPEKPAVPAQGAELTDADKRKALAAGIDWRAAVDAHPDKSPRGAVVEAMRRARQARAKGENVAEDQYLGRLRHAVTDIMRMADADGAQTPEEVADIITGLAKDAEYADFGDDLGRYVDVLMEKANERGLLFDDPVDLAPDVDLSSMQQKRAKAIARAMRQADPDLDDDAVIILAKNEVLREDNLLPGESLTRSSGEAAANTTYETAGRTRSGRIQGFLRRSSAIAKGSDYGIGGDVEYPMAHKFSLDEALVKGRGPTGKGTELVRFIATGKEPVKVAGQKNATTVPAGTFLYADPITGHAYVDEDYARYMRNEPGTKSKGAITADEAPKPKKTKAVDRAKSPDQLKRILKAKADGKSLAEDVPVTTGEKALIIRNKETGDFRMMSAKQVAEGKTLRDLLGKGDPDDWEVRYGEQPKKRTQASLAKVWDAAEPSDETVPPVSDQPKAVGEPNTPDGPPPRLYDDVRQMEVDLTQTDQAALAQAAQVIGVTLPKSKVTMAVVEALKHRIETAGWELPLNMRAKALASLNEISARHVPEGIFWDMETRADSVARIRNIFTRYSAEEADQAAAFVEGLAGNAGPKFVLPEGVDGGSAHTRSYLSGDSAIQLDLRGNTLPRLMHLYHEVAHWSYYNILTDGDRAEFWRAMEKHEAAGAEGRAAYLAVNGKFTEGNRVFTANDNISPQEMWANQFVMHVLRKEGNMLGQEGYWKRMLHYVKGVFQRFSKGAQIDPDLEPLFARILPDDQEAVKFRTNEVAPASYQPKTPAGKAALKHLLHLRLASEEMADAIARDSDEGVLNAAADMARMLKSWGARGGNKLKMLGKWHTVINHRYDNLKEAMGLQGEDLTELHDYQAAIEQLGDGITKRAAAVRSLFEDGVAGEWQPEGNPFRGKPEYSSLSSLITVAESRLRSAFRESEGLFPPGETPKSITPKAERATAEAPRKKTAKAKAAKKVERKTKQADAAAKALTAKKAKSGEVEWSAQHLARAQKRLGETNIKSASPQKLRAILTDWSLHQGTATEYAYPEEVAFELMRKTQARDLPKRAVKVPAKIADMSNADLEAAFLDSLVNSTDKKTKAQLTYELTRRAKGDGNASAKLLKPTSEDLRAAVTREVEDNAAGQEQLGIPANAPAHVRELLSYMTHRDPVVTGTMRTLAYRMLNLMGKGTHEALSGAAVLSAADMARMAGVDPSTVGPAVFGDFRSPAFNKLRADQRKLAVGLTKGEADPLDLMHEIGHLITRTGMLPSAESEAVRALYRMAKSDVKTRINELYSGKYADRAPDELEGLLADEWMAEEFAKYMLERVTRGDVYETLLNGDTLNLPLKTRFEAAIDRMVEYAAYLVNGLLGRKTLRQEFRRAMFYGDMLEAAPRYPLAHVGKHAQVSPELAAQYASDVLRASPKERVNRIMAFVGNGAGRTDAGPRTFYHGTPNGAALRRGTSPDAVVRMSKRGNFGPGFYVTADPNPADEVYSRTATPQAMLEKIKSENPDMLEDDIAEAEDVIFALHETRSELARLRREAGALAMDADKGDQITAFLAEEDLGNKFQEIINLHGLVDELEADLDAMGYAPDAYVAPVYIRLENPADFRRTAAAADHLKFIQVTANRLGLSGIQIDQNSDMHRVYRAFVDGLSVDMPRDDAQTMLNQTLKDMGYDGLLTTHVNTVGVEGSAEIPGTDTTFLGQRVAHEVPVLFDPEQVKHVEASDFDADNPGLYAREPEGLPRVVNSTIVDAIQEDLITGIKDVLPSSVASAAEKAGDTGLGSYVMSMMRGRAPTPRETEAALKLGPAGWISTQAAQLEHMGMKWLAPWYEQQFSDVVQGFGKRFHPIHRQLKKLPDAHGAVRNWARAASGSIGQDQPASYTKIMKALRRPTGSRQEKALSVEERAVYQSIREYFQGERRNLVSLGISMGDRGDDYVPQVWSIQAIEKKAAEFKIAMANYFETEALATGKERQAGDAEQFADRMYARLVGDDTDGIFLPQGASGSKSTMHENADYSRMIQLDKHPEALKELEPFLENDLEGVLAKYMDASARRETWVKKTGVNGHALYDYMKVVDQGVSGIADLLSTNKTFKRQFNVLDWEGQPEEMALEIKVPMPFHGRDDQATKFAEALTELHNVSGTGAAREALMEIAPRTVSGEVPQAYLRRVDAIVGALDDFKGQKTDLKNPEFNFVEDAVRVAQRKARHATNPRAARASGVMRTFNSVTLLSFTTLTSLGDLALPLIRSGSMKNWTSAMKKFAEDPHYRDLIAGTGVAIENILHERQLHMFGATDTKLSNAFFNATGLTPWTNLNRKLAGAVGFESIKTMQRKAVDTFKEGVPLTEQSRSYRTAHRFMASVGLEDFLPGGARAGETLDNLELLESDDVVRQAVVRFADKAIFTPNPNDIPLWAQTPIGALVFQLKSFPLMMGRLSKDVILEAKKGNVMPLVYFATLGPAFGMGALAAKDIVQMRGGEDGESAELRKRNALKWLGYDEKVHGDEDTFMGWYLEGAMAMGGLGLIGDMAFGISNNAENGAYGQVRTASMIGGPSVGSGFAALTVFSGLKDRDESNAKERSAAREVATRLPVIGGIRKARESIVDALAGETDDRGHWSTAQSGYDWN